MAKVGNEAKLILKLAQERASTARRRYQKAVDEIRKENPSEQGRVERNLGRVEGMEHFENILVDIFVEMESK